MNRELIDKRGNKGYNACIWRVAVPDRKGARTNEPIAEVAETMLIRNMVMRFSGMEHAGGELLPAGRSRISACGKGPGSGAAIPAA